MERILLKKQWTQRNKRSWLSIRFSLFKTKYMSNKDNFYGLKMSRQHLDEPSVDDYSGRVTR
jgi:hypothetical protein